MSRDAGRAPTGVVSPMVTDLATPHGPARLHTYAAGSGGARPEGTMLLSHGAGGGVDARDLVALATTLPAQGITVALLEQPWRVAGRKIAGPPPTLDAALMAAVEVVDGPLLVLGGRSAGARSACRCATEAGAGAVLALSFPLHPPGKPERSRRPELEGAGVPVLVVQGERDPMGRPEEFPDVDGVDLTVVPAADHGLKVPRSAPLDQDQAMDVVVEATLEWAVREAGLPPRA